MMGHQLPGSTVWIVLICLALVSASHFVNKRCRVNYYIVWFTKCEADTSARQADTSARPNQNNPNNRTR